MSSCYQCHATIRSPWKMGMTLSCQRSPGHGEMHSFATSGAVPPRSVTWTGQEDKLTARAVAGCYNCKKAARTAAASAGPVRPDEEPTT